MTALLICAALRVEARAVRRGLPAGAEGVRVVRTGLGPLRAARVAARLPAHGALAVTGFGGALDDGLCPGDVLVAGEVRYGDRIFPCASAPLLARELDRAGLRVRAGPLVTCDHVVSGAERGRLAARGARAADMETGPLAAVSAGVPFAAVRVILDTPAAPLLHPGTLYGGWAARRALRALGPALLRWARAVGAGQAPPSRARSPSPRDDAGKFVQFTLPKEVPP